METHDHVLGGAVIRQGKLPQPPTDGVTPSSINTTHQQSSILVLCQGWHNTPPAHIPHQWNTMADI
ncbi:hypothetical protein L1O59_005636 [Salmonella enterica]|nr:hypothetical protein [Salmonella enterica]EGP7686582.1 hypothetical protein [Salmonella enterica]EIH1700193.1 hypothetical protein [Salmonella enterica]EIS9097427.1 hypothetical protein [Salmonella enterica]EIT2140427.1 hypothetical protein [Salmonella enterica]